MRLAALLPCLFACSQTVDERIAELDGLASVDCGSLLECETHAEVEAVLTCLQDNLDAGVPARAYWIVGLDPVAYVYAIDGEYIKVEGYYFDDEPEFTESRCRDLQVVDQRPTCSTVRASDCTTIDEW